MNKFSSIVFSRKLWNRSTTEEDAGGQQARKRRAPFDENDERTCLDYSTPSHASQDTRALQNAKLQPLSANATRTRGSPPYLNTRRRDKAPPFRAQPAEQTPQSVERQQGFRPQDTLRHENSDLVKEQDLTPRANRSPVGNESETYPRFGFEDQESPSADLDNNDHQLRQDSRQLAQELNIYKKKCSQLEADAAVSNARSKQYEQTVSRDQKKLEEENGSLRKSLKDAENSNKSTTEESRKLDAKYESLQSRHEVLQTRHSAMNTDNRKLVADNQKLEARVRALEKLEAKVKALEEHNTSITADLFEALEREEKQKKDTMAKGLALPKVADDIIVGKWKSLEFAVRNMVKNNLIWDPHRAAGFLQERNNMKSGYVTMRKGSELCLAEGDTELGQLVLRAFVWRWLTLAVLENDTGVWGGGLGLHFSIARDYFPAHAQNYDQAQMWVNIRTRAAAMIDTQVGLADHEFLALAEAFTNEISYFISDPNNAQNVYMDVQAIIRIAVELHAIFMKSRAIFMIHWATEEATHFDFNDEHMRVVYCRGEKDHPQSSAMYITPILAKRGNADGKDYQKVLVLEKAQVIV